MRALWYWLRWGWVTSGAGWKHLKRRETTYEWQLIQSAKIRNYHRDEVEDW